VVSLRVKASNGRSVALLLDVVVNGSKVVDTIWFIEIKVIQATVVIANTLVVENEVRPVELLRAKGVVLASRDQVLLLRLLVFLLCLILRRNVLGENEESEHVNHREHDERALVTKAVVERGAEEGTESCADSTRSLHH